MKRRKRLEITFETRQLVIRRHRPAAAVWCVECAAVVAWVTPEEAAALAGVSTRVVYRWVEAEKVHFMEAANVHALICLYSLLRLTGEGGSNHGTEQIGNPCNHD